MRYSGEASNSKTFWFEPDENALHGRYFDGSPISEHPSEHEISTHWEFWVALCGQEQKEVIQAQFDIRVAMEFNKAVKNKDSRTIVQEAINWWIKWYPWDYKAFMEQIKVTRAGLINKGWDKTKIHYLKGQIPHRVKQLVNGVKPELNRYKGKNETEFQSLFYDIFSTAKLGG
jgi:hypothetical protein